MLKKIKVCSWKHKFRNHRINGGKNSHIVNEVNLVSYKNCVNMLSSRLTFNKSVVR